LTAENKVPAENDASVEDDSLLEGETSAEGALAIEARGIEGVKEPGWLERKVGKETARMIKGLLTNPLSVMGLLLLLFFILVAVFAPVLAPDPDLAKQEDVSLWQRFTTPLDRIPRDGFHPNPKPPGTVWKSRQPPLPIWWKAVMSEEHKDTWVHIMGTASGQWDIYYGVVWGTRTAFRVGLLITAVTATVGIIVGSVSAYYGGAIDMILMRIADLFITFPTLVAAMTLSAILTPVLGKGIVPAMIALMVFGWTGYARLLRSDVLSVRQREYVLAARVTGVRDWRIMFRHILPNAIFPTLVVASMRLGDIVLTFAGLSFLGIGAEEGYPDWGQLISFARAWITSLGEYWYIIVFPGVALLLFGLSWNLVGDALRDILDPRLQGSR
jgi:peptide/nickel transport system permease protein